jgi:type II secretory ATPase GspE/PulE/Tfp pilus assembly ATPase PilB-like protein
MEKPAALKNGAVPSSRKDKPSASAAQPLGASATKKLPEKAAEKIYEKAPAKPEEKAKRSSAPMAMAMARAAPKEGDATEETSEQIVFQGNLLTAMGGAIKIPQESRNLCALFDTGLWLVSASHRNSPLVTSVAATARRMGFTVNNAHLVTPDVIKAAYNYFERQISSLRLDENAVRRQIVRTIQAGAESGANDIHIEANAGRTRVEFRIDGTLRMWETWTQKEGEQFLSAVYSHSSGQSGATANWLEPQAAMLTPGSGPDVISLAEGILAVRCQWVPLADGGRYLNMRLQYDSARIFGEKFIQSDVDQLGFNQEQTDMIRYLRRIPGGMRIFSGPVNQGKTTTLRVMLNRHMAETNMEQKCYMIEDPPEGGVIGASQIGVSATVKDEQRDRSFSEIMRCILRLDPNIVMLGETRDLQTVKFIFRLALTGRQVYTTLHVYAAIAIPQRLRDLGGEPYLVYDHHLLVGLICQRLLRGLCPHCRIPASEITIDHAHDSILRRIRAGLAIMNATRRLPREDADPFDYLEEPDMRGVYFINPDGCRHCYQGRAGRSIVAEVIATDGKLMSLLAENKLEEASRYWLSPFGLNGITMQWHALEKIRDGTVAPFDAELEVGPCASDKEIRRVEERLRRVERWKA